MANHKEGCDWEETYFGVYSRESNGPDELLRITPGGITYDPDLFWEYGDLQKVDFNYCPICGVELN